MEYRKVYYSNRSLMLRGVRRMLSENWFVQSIVALASGTYRVEYYKQSNAKASYSSLLKNKPAELEIAS